MSKPGPRPMHSVGPRDNPSRPPRTAPGATRTAGRRPAGQRTAEELSAEIDGLMSKGQGRDAVFGFGSLLGMAGLAILCAAPLGWALNYLGLIPGPVGFERGPAGRELAMVAGRDLVRPAYWLGLGLLGYALQICRPLVPLLLIGGVVWWSWLGLYMAYEAGLIVMPISPPAAR
ncbi:MAG: hypothetical protein EON47_11465 [Acetobacteraceae bacterium]|nr:MAG: hypothetical protein EON47_11465 [Acetobacteraceae bacterium]